MRLRSLPLFALVGLSAACSSTPDPITIREPQTPVTCAQEPKPDRLDLKDTPPLVVLNTETNVWGYWLSPSVYADLAENLQAMRRNMRQERAVSAYYRACIEDHNAAIAAEEDEQ